MRYLLSISLFVFLFGQTTFAQSSDNVSTSDTISIEKSNPLEILNPEVLFPFFKELQSLETKKEGKVRMVQIGDSHIQADFSTNIIKDIFQQKFGNGGLGFIFPHRLVKTNGTSKVNFKSNANFSSSRNVRPADENPIGIAGYTISTSNRNAVIEVDIKNEQDYPNSIKIITPNKERFFNVGFANGNRISLEKQTIKAKNHKVKKGETLSSISRKYGVSIDFIKKSNGLKSNNLAIGKSLKVGEEKEIESEVSIPNFDLVDLTFDDKSFSYHSPKAIDEFYLIGNESKSDYKLSGLLLENNQSGITFSGIGVNGAKLSDYNQFDMFFDQLQVLNPNLIIVSLGTNESFDGLIVADYMVNLQIFVTKVKQTNPNTAILVTTPPPSTLHKRFENTYIAEYTKGIIEFANTNKTIAVFDMYQAFGGENGVKINKQKGFLAKDEVHYTKEGYEQQGKILAEALLNAYQNYISNK